MAPWQDRDPRAPVVRVVCGAQPSQTALQREAEARLATAVKAPPEVGDQSNDGEITVLEACKVHDEECSCPSGGAMRPSGRNETYGLSLSKRELVVDARTSWALANAMATLYQLLEVRKAGHGLEIIVPGCPHEIVDAFSWTPPAPTTRSLESGR